MVITMSATCCGKNIPHFVDFDDAILAPAIPYVWSDPILQLREQLAALQKRKSHPHEND
jgi:hypothetical protein